MPTPHNSALPGDFAKTVLMPGDPLRSKYIAEHFLSDTKLVNNVRGVQGYTGTWKGTSVSVMASGMGIPSIGIYSYELFTMYDVKNIIRVGSCGGLQDSVKVGDIVLAMGASTNSNLDHVFEIQGTYAPIADYLLLKTAADLSLQKSYRLHVGNIYSSDFFYNPKGSFNEELRRMGILAIEMEAAGLYTIAAYTGKRALSILTVSDHLFSSEEMTAEERETGLTDMIELALDTAAAVDKI